MNYHANYGGPGTTRAYSGTVVPAYTTCPATGVGWIGNDSNLGIFGFESVTDGTSNTALFSERLVGLGTNPPTLGSQDGPKRGIYSVGTGYGINSGPANTLTYYQACKALPSSTPSGGSYLSGAHWALSYPWHISNNSYTHFNTPNGISCYETSAYSQPWGGPTGIITATSNHSGGVNVCMTDGSVKFIKDSISYTTWWAVGTRNGAEVISADAL